MTTISKNVNQGDSVSIQATPKTGYTFSGWTSGAGDSRISTDNPYTFTPNADTTINAVFSEATPIISWVGNPGNLVIKNSNGQTHNLWSAAGTNKYFGDVEGFGADDIVSVYISGNDPDGTSSLIEHTWLTELNLSGLTHLTLGQRSFANCTTLTAVVLPTSSYSIASIKGSHAGAFQGCTSLSSLTLGGCTSIGAYAFYGCSALRTVNIPGSCTTIGTNAFTRAGISTLTLAEGIQTIGQYAFCNNYRMTAISFPSTLSSYGKGAFLGCYGLATITMNNNSGTYYTTSGNCLYEISSRSVVLGCKTSTIPTSSWNVNKIFDSAFNEMIKSGANVNLTIPSNITSIGDSAFYGCNGLTGVSFSGSGLTTLMSYAFYGCTGLTTITLPSSFSYFGTSSSSTGTYCFGGCTNLATVYMNSINTPPTIYRGVGTNTVSISLFPSTIQKIYVKPGTMSSYQADTNGWDYWYNQKKLYIGIGISSDVSPAGSSTVSTSSNNVEFQSDSAAPVVILTATPNTGYTFSSWNRGSTVLSTSNPYNATVVDDGTGTDEFTALSTVASYSISASVNPNGGGTVSGTGTYSYGDSCTVSATSNTGYDFVNWTEDGSTVSSSASYTFTVSQARTLVANFELQTITISAGPNTSGYGTVSGNSGTYSYGDSVSLVATAASGYEFVNWTENGTEVSTNSTYTFTATQDRTLVANFAVASYTISATVDPVAYGTVSGTGSYLVGSTCTLTFTPESGYMLKNWTESGTSVSNDNPYSFTVSGNRTLVCNATVRTNPLVVKTNGAGSIKLKNNSNQEYTWNLENGTNNYYGTEPGFELNNLKSIYKSEGIYVNNNYITEINITSTSITQIPDNAFRNCKALTWMYPSDLTSIGNYAFSGCTAWTNYVYFPSTLQSIGQYAFDGSNISGEVNFTSSFTSLGQYAFQNTKITKVDLHLCSSLTEIPVGSFKGCTYITQININKVRNIKSSAFNGCTSLTSITFNTSTSTPLTEIGEGAFNGCTSLSSFTIPSNGSYLTSLSRSSFYNTAWWNNQAAGIVYKQNICFGPKTDPTAYTADVSITSGTLIIAGYAFQDLYKSSITSDRNTVKHIYVPYTCTKIFRNAFNNVGGSADIYDWDDWDDDGKPRHADLNCFVYGPVAIEIGDSTNGSNLTSVATCAFGYSRIYEARGYSINTDDLDDEYPSEYPGGQGYLKFYGTTCPTVNNINVFTESSYDLGDDVYYTPKVYVKSASFSSYQTGLSAYLSRIELTTF